MLEHLWPLAAQLVLAVFATYFATTLSRPKPRGERRKEAERAAGANAGVGGEGK